MKVERRERSPESESPQSAEHGMLDADPQLEGQVRNELLASEHQAETLSKVSGGERGQAQSPERIEDEIRS